MKSLVLILSLALAMGPVFADVSRSFGHGMTGRPPCQHGAHFGPNSNYRPNFGYYNNGFTPNPFYRRKYGTLTGFSPPVNYAYNPGYTTTYSTNTGYYQSSPYYSDNVSLGTKIKRFFNPNYNNHYLNSPGYNPYLNGNYNNLNNNRYIPLYGNDPTGTSSGAAVTIID